MRAVQVATESDDKVETGNTGVGGSRTLAAQGILHSLKRKQEKGTEGVPGS